MEGIWKRAFGKGLLEEGKFLEGNWHAPIKTYSNYYLKREGGLTYTTTPKQWFGQMPSIIDVARLVLFC